MYQAVIFSFKVLQNFIVYKSAEDRNLRAIFNRVKKNIILCINIHMDCWPLRFDMTGNRPGLIRDVNIQA